MFKSSSLIRADLGLHSKNLNLSLDGGMNEYGDPTSWDMIRNCLLDQGDLLLG